MEELHYLLSKYSESKDKGYSVAGLVSETKITHEDGDTLTIERVGNLVGVFENDVNVATYLDFSVLEK